MRCRLECGADFAWRAFSRSGGELVLDGVAALGTELELDGAVGAELQLALALNAERMKHLAKSLPPIATATRAVSVAVVHLQHRRRQGRVRCEDLSTGHGDWGDVVAARRGSHDLRVEHLCP